MAPMTASRIYLAPGASGEISQLRLHRDALVGRGLEVELLSLPKGTAERAMPIYRDAVPEATRRDVAIGGQSFGGRVASLISAESPPAALVLFCYPLHAPGRQEAWRDRTAHWPAVACPVLLLSGEADPFARIDLLREAVDQLPDATLHTWPGVGHGLRPVLDEAMERVVDFLAKRT
jgi:predicted alpha/beta-hydrolase family hydrolase